VTGVAPQLPAIGVVEVGIVSVVVTVGVDEVSIDRAPAPIAEDPGRFAPQRAARYLLQLLGEAGVGPLVVGDPPGLGAGSGQAAFSPVWRRVSVWSRSATISVTWRAVGGLPGAALERAPDVARRP
jgi:hypothetical protein